MAEQRTPLCEMALEFGTDKCGWHHYTEHYYKLFKDRREEVKKVLEIGIGDVEGMSHTVPNYRPGASLRMWQKFFPNAEIYAIDNCSNLLINEGRIHSFCADQGNERSMRSLFPELGTDFDLIVDDGSHVPEHQLNSAKLLVPLLAPGGVYVIEDVWPYPSTVGWSKEPFGLKLSDIPYPLSLIQCGDNANSDDHLVVIRP